MKQKRNHIMKGTSGKLADQVVFKQVYGQTVIAKVAQPREYDSPAQEAVKMNFKQASVHARGLLLNPVIKAFYTAQRKGHQHARNVALHDIYDIPVIELILAKGYTGRAGNIITFFAQKNNFVKEMLVTIANSDGVVIETGYALQAGNSTEWNYTATQSNTMLSGSIITIEAADYAGNKAVYTKEVIVKEKSNDNTQQQEYTFPAQHYLTPITSLRLLPDVFAIPYVHKCAHEEDQSAIALKEHDIGFAEDA